MQDFNHLALLPTALFLVGVSIVLRRSDFLAMPTRGEWLARDATVQGKLVPFYS